MIRIIVPQVDTPHPLSLYLAVEEWVARYMPPAEYYMIWRVAPTVIVGRCQRADLEVDLDYCRSHGIDVQRRRSGGGCVYADTNNLMLSLISNNTDVQSAFAGWAASLAGILADAGLDAHASGRNDVLISGSKVSGCAYYLAKQPDGTARSIVHGTMLVDIDWPTMSRALTPARAKLKSKGVKSVESRITCLADHIPGYTADRAERLFADALTTGTYTLTEADMQEVEHIRQHYDAPDWRPGHHRGPRPAISAARYIDGVGMVQFSADTADGKLLQPALNGDFFIIGDMEALLARLCGVATDRQSVIQALGGFDPGTVVRGLDADTLAQLVCQSVIESSQN